MSRTNSPTVQPSSSNPQQDQQPQPRGFAFDKVSPSCPYNTTPQWASHLNGSEPVSGRANAFKRPQQSLLENLLSGNSGSFSTSGVLGQNTTKPEMTTAAFGGPATGFGAFDACATTFGGSASTFGSTTRPPTAGNVFFGSTTNTGGTCGSGGKLNGPNMPAFEGKPVTDQGGKVAPAPIGTALPPYSVYIEQDPSSTAELQYCTISAMPPYRGTSLEELRMQDYQQGRKSAGAFGSFGTPATRPINALGTAAPRQPTTSSFLEFGQGREHFKPPLNSRARMFRHDGTRSSALNIICHLLDSDTTGIQRAFGDEHEEYIYTAAGEGLTNALRKQSRGYDEKLQSLRADMETAVKARDEEIRQEMQTELKRKGEELERIKRELESTTEKFASDKTKLESRITETETTNRQQVERLQDLQNLVSQALLQVMKPQTETARQKEEQERQARILAEERLANVLTSTDRHDKIQAVRDEMNKRLNALQDEVSRITLEKADGQGQNDSEATGIYTDGHGKDREMNRKQKERAKR